MNTIIFTVILLVILAIGIFLLTKDFDSLAPMAIGAILTVTSTVIIFIHIICLLTMSYSYERLIIERNAFETTLNDARLNGSQYETATILRDVAAWNTKLAGMQYDNTTFVFGQYVDDRIKDVKPIK